MNVKPGNIAIVIKQRVTPENIGRIVEIVSLALPGEVFETSIGPIELDPSVSGTIWRVKVKGVPLAWKGCSGSNVVPFAWEVPMCDSYLKPVSGLPLEEEEPQVLRENS